MLRSLTLARAYSHLQVTISWVILRNRIKVGKNHLNLTKKRIKWLGLSIWVSYNLLPIVLYICDVAKMYKSYLVYIIKSYFLGRHVSVTNCRARRRKGRASNSGVLLLHISWLLLNSCLLLIRRSLRLLLLKILLCLKRSWLLLVLINS